MKITDEIGITKVDSQVEYTTNEQLNNLTNQSRTTREHASFIGFVELNTTRTSLNPSWARVLALR